MAAPKAACFTAVYLAIGIIAAVVAVISVGLTIAFMKQSAELKLEKERAAALLFDKDNPYNVKLTNNLTRHEWVRKKLFGKLDGARIRNELHFFSGEVHLAGTTEQLSLASRLEEKLKQFGLTVRTTEYRVVLSTPNFERPNALYQLPSMRRLTSGHVDAIGPFRRQLLEPKRSRQRETYLWTANAPAGDVTASIAYGNYCLRDDFDLLEKLDVPVAGNIVLCRLGRSKAGDKVANAQQRLAKAVILFHDPQDWNPGYPKVKSFPDSLQLPGGAAALINVYDSVKAMGDVETPFYPAKEYAYRSRNQADVREAGFAPKIPVAPVGYDGARVIFETMGENSASVPHNFTGGLDSGQYKLYSGDSAKYRLIVTSGQLVERSIRNVCAYIKGTEEPDRYVLLGSHLDAWTRGAIDAGTGTAILIELARVMAELNADERWRPRRTLMFCFWDGAKQGALGSINFVEEYLKVLEGRLVAYLNADAPIQGNLTFFGAALPELREAIQSATQLVPNPNKDEARRGRNTVYDSWSYYGGGEEPQFGYPNFTTDAAYFVNYLGASAADLGYRNVPHDCFLRDTVYEHVWTVENLIDTDDFSVSSAFAKVWAELARNLADSLIIPFNVEHLARAVETAFDEFDRTVRRKQLDGEIPNYSRSVYSLKDAVRKFGGMAGSFQDKVRRANGGGSAGVFLHRVETLNNRLTQLERAFVQSRGAGSLRLGHALFGDGAANFPTLSEAVDAYEKARQHGGNYKQRESRLSLIQQAITQLQYVIESATMLLDVDHCL